MALSNHRPHRRSSKRGPFFVIQHREQSDDYYDFRLEIDGVLVSWAIPRGPTVNPQNRRMARRTEDHPLEDIATKVDGAGEDVFVWDCGTYANKTDHEMTTCLGRGHLSFLLDGEKLHGGYALTRVREGEDETWLLVKRRDDVAEPVNHVNG
ncbi:hypothetical protein A5658_21610 [Mycobacterium sp. 1245111.1]|uniref:DNA polymerase ligase N-terminal domain-containing protein n=1 Tax=Mycobacterium sp. 1245111.1 TaxID=1834073 RepID=UPI0008006E2C|nr:DNA polymerase ligase N-terminal domain-containing protein [Mycobacterium sp. 1245111.1]OBK40390.1 hypothetical protein A5658_21610 [Mycobacterium sp. 1245111.1]